QEFEEESCHAVNEQERAEYLAIELAALQQPHEHDQIHNFDSGLKQLRGLERHVQRGSGDFVRQVIGKRDAPPVVSFLAVAASGGEATQASDRVAQSEAGSK